MIHSRSFDLIAASILARAPNFILPIFIARVLDFHEYSIFALAFATASASSAFLAEAIAATISRESHRAEQGAEGIASLCAFFRTGSLTSFLVIVTGVFFYYGLISQESEGTGPRSTLALATLLLVPAYLLPAPGTALANACGSGRVSVLASLFGVPIAIGVSLALGAKSGVLYFLVSYCVLTLLTNLFVYRKVSQVNGSRGHRKRGALSGFAFIFFYILAPFLLGGPVHGLCLAVLGRHDSGIEQVALFVAYYPWSMAVSVFSAVLGNYVVQTVVEVERNHSVLRLRKFLGYLLAGNLMLASLLSVCLWFGMDFALALYGPTIARNPTLFGWMLVTGIAAAFINSTSQIIIATGRGKGLLLCAILHATVYFGLTGVFVGLKGLGAIGLIQALFIALFFLALAHLILIAFHVQRLGQAYPELDRAPS